MRIEDVEMESDNSSKADLVNDSATDVILVEIRNRINFFRRCFHQLLKVY